MRLILIPLLFFVASCGHVSSNVARFHRIDEHQGKTVFILPMNNEQESSIEFENYKEVAGQELSKYGVTVTDKVDKSDWIMIMLYGVSGSQTEVSSSPVYGQTSGGTSYSSGTVNSYTGGSYSYSGSTYSTPTFGVVGSQTTSKKTFNRYLNIKIFPNDSKQKRGTASSSKPKAIFEGSVKSTGENAHFQSVSKCLFKSILKDFPGEKSQTFSSNEIYPCE